MNQEKEQFISVCINKQVMKCYENDRLIQEYIISTAKNGAGELRGSECTPRGEHRIYSKIGTHAVTNSVFVGRQWTGEIYSPMLAAFYPQRDWILTRILQLEGMEEGRNRGGEVDSLDRYIYIHGTPDSTILGQPGSHGCIRMFNQDVIQLTNWVNVGTKIDIK